MQPPAMLVLVMGHRDWIYFECDFVFLVAELQLLILTDLHVDVGLGLGVENS